MKVYLYLIDLPHVYHNINSFCEVFISFTLIRIYPILSKESEFVQTILYYIPPSQTVG